MTAPSVDPLAKSSLQGRSGSLDDALISLCDHVEALASGSIAGLTICNPSRTHIERAVFPRLPQFATAIRAIPLSPSDFGSCVQAIAHGEIITCHDIAVREAFRSTVAAPVPRSRRPLAAIATGLSISASADRMPRSCLPTCNRAWKPTGMSH
jgi:hypothetical protein